MQDCRQRTRFSYPNPGVAGKHGVLLDENAEGAHLMTPSEGNCNTVRASSIKTKPQVLTKFEKGGAVDLAGSQLLRLF